MRIVLVLVAAAGCAVAPEPPPEPQPQPTSPILFVVHAGPQTGTQLRFDIPPTTADALLIVSLLKSSGTDPIPGTMHAGNGFVIEDMFIRASDCSRSVLLYTSRGLTSGVTQIVLDVGAPLTAAADLIELVPGTVLDSEVNNLDVAAGGVTHSDTLEGCAGEVAIAQIASCGAVRGNDLFADLGAEDGLDTELGIVKQDQLVGANWRTTAANSFTHLRTFRPPTVASCH